MQTEAEKEAANRLKDFVEAAQKSAGADKAALAMAALDLTQTANRVSPKLRRWAYLLAIGLPPLGLVFAVIYALSGKIDGKRAAFMCVMLTAVGLALLWFSYKAFLASVPPETQIQLRQLQTQGVNLDEIKDLLQ